MGRDLYASSGLDVHSPADEVLHEASLDQSYLDADVVCIWGESIDVHNWVCSTPHIHHNVQVSVSVEIGWDGRSFTGGASKDGRIRERRAGGWQDRISYQELVLNTAATGAKEDVKCPVVVEVSADDRAELYVLDEGCRALHGTKRQSVEHRVTGRDACVEVEISASVGRVRSSSPYDTEEAVVHEVTAVRTGFELVGCSRRLNSTA